MKRLHGLDGLRQITPGSVVSIGNFDGVHRGHRRILDLAASLRAGSASGRVAIVTFEPHPFTVLRPEHVPPRLTPPAMKQELLAAAGVDEYVILPPTADVLNLSAELFWALLRDEVRPAHLIEGESFTFGKGRGGTIERLRAWCADSSVKLHTADAVTVPLLDMHVVPVSSSLIRWLIERGRVRDAAICLGRAYTLQGEVIRGHQRGRTIGVPTANLDCGEQVVPADGVYAARCTIDNATYPAALSIGTLPTFGQHARQIEAHLIGFDGDLYDRTLRVDVLDWVREQWKFNGIDALKQRIAKDIDLTRERLDLEPAQPVEAHAQ